MAKNLNSVTRLLRILERTSGHANNTPVIEVWAKLLEVAEEHPIRRAVAVTQLLQNMHRELEIATVGLSTASFSKNLYEKAFSHVENAISPMLLPHTWNNVTNYLTPEVFTALAFCAEILPDEESEISSEELQAIREKVEELKAALVDTDTPVRLQSLIQHHIELIERALAEYLVVGAKALREAGRTALGEMIEAREAISSCKDSPAVSKLESVWKSVNNAADIALKAEKLTQLGQKAWDAISSIM